MDLKKCKSIQMDEVSGFKMLSGVGYGSMGDSRYHKSEVFTFVLDDKAYSAIEDPDDGYRSHLGGFYISDHIPKHVTRFPETEVLCLCNEDIGDDNDILSLYDSTTGCIVVEIGTDYTDSYYPFFVDNYTPENMVCNNPDLRAGQRMLAGEPMKIPLTLWTDKGSKIKINIDSTNDLISVFKILESNDCMSGVTTEVVTLLFISGFI